MIPIPLSILTALLSLQPLTHGSQIASQPIQTLIKRTGYAVVHGCKVIVASHCHLGHLHKKQNFQSLYKLSHCPNKKSQLSLLTQSTYSVFFIPYHHMARKGSNQNLRNHHHQCTPHPQNTKGSIPPKIGSSPSLKGTPNTIRLFIRVTPSLTHRPSYLHDTCTLLILSPQSQTHYPHFNTHLNNYSYSPDLPIPKTRMEFSRIRTSPQRPTHLKHHHNLHTCFHVGTKALYKLLTSVTTRLSLKTIIHQATHNCNLYAKTSPQGTPTSPFFPNFPTSSIYFR